MADLCISGVSRILHPFSHGLHGAVQERGTPSVSLVLSASNAASCGHGRVGRKVALLRVLLGSFRQFFVPYLRNEHADIYARKGRAHRHKRRFELTVCTRLPPPAAPRSSLCKSRSVCFPLVFNCPWTKGISDTDR